MDTKETDTGVTWTLTKTEAEALLAIASKDAGRANLCAIHFGDHAVATDGHRMLCHEPQTADRGRHVTLQRAPLETLSKVKGCKAVSIHVEHGSGEAVTGTALDREERPILSMRLPELEYGTFPPYMRVFPSSEPATCEPAFNPAYMGDAMTALSKAGVPVVTIRSSGSLDPMTICGDGLEGGRWAYALMPMRADGSFHWAPRAAEEEAANAA